jgi:hypothetical protein
MLFGDADKRGYTLIARVFHLCQSVSNFDFTNKVGPAIKNKKHGNPCLANTKNLAPGEAAEK